MRILAVLTVRDEGPFLLEWVAHHRAAGVTDILAFSNDCRDGTDAMLDRLATMGLVTHIRNPGPHDRGPQWQALRAADRHPLRVAADWAVTLDIDEFLAIRTGDGTLGALLAAMPGATAVALTWRMFGNAGEVGIADIPVTRRFTRAAPRRLHWPWRAQQIKTLFSTRGAFARFGVHRPRAPDPARLEAEAWYDGAGRRLPPGFVTGPTFSAPGQDHYALAQINHYALGSAQDYLVKCDRGRANRAAGAFDLGYWIDRNFCDEADAAILPLADRAAPLLDGLRTDPVLARLHGAALDWRRARFAELMASGEEWRALYGRLLMTPPTRALTAEEARSVWDRGETTSG